MSLDQLAQPVSGGRSEVLESFLRRVETREAVVGIVGLGYVGLPLAQVFAESNIRTIGFDTDPEKVDTLNRGESYIRHIPESTVKQLYDDGRFRATNAVADLSEADAILLCVPTPLTRYRDPDISAVSGSAESLVSVLRKGHLIVLESTTYPGTTDEILKPILERSGLTAGEDFYLAYSPEREDPGNVDFRTSTIPKIVGADDHNSRIAANALYGAAMQQTVAVSNSRTGEAIKLTENIFRSVNIALVNELKVIFSEMNVDVWEVIDGAKTKPFGFMAFYPGPGLGGHCIPIDPFYLSWKAREFDMNARFIELAGEVNTAMPRRVVEQLALALDQRSGVALSRSRVLVAGLAYKKNVDDIRESPALRLIEMLEERQAQVDYHDPCVPVVPRTREHDHLTGRQSVSWTREVLQSYDAVLIATDHDGVDYRLLGEAASLIVDTRNVMAREGLDLDHVVKA